MQIKKVNIDNLKLADENVRMHPTKQINEYVRSLKMFGQIKNAVIDEEYNVLVGNGLILALKQMKIKEVSVLIKKGLSDNEKKKLMLSDNKVFSLGVDDLNTIDKFIENLVGDLDIPGFDESILNSMVATAEQVTEEVLQYGILDDEKVEEIKNAPKPTMYETKKEETTSQNNFEENQIKNETISTVDEEIETQEEKIKIKCAKCGDDICYQKNIFIN